MSAHSVAAIAAFSGFSFAFETVTIASVSKDAMVSDVPFHDALVEGGQAESGTMWLKMPISSYAEGSEPAQFSTVVARGKTMKLLFLQRFAGHIFVTLGDTAHER
jgi:hypothetical protein